MGASHRYLHPTDEVWTDPPGGGYGTPLRDAELAIIASLSEHGKHEGAALDAYQQVAEKCEDPGIRYLIEMILADEHRHHQQIAEMLNQVESFLWEIDVEPRVPYARWRRDPELREATDRLLKIEREDAAELRQLRREVRSQPTTSLLPLLVELMIRDTAKHIEILKYIKRLTKP